MANRRPRPCASALRNVFAALLLLLAAAATSAQSTGTKPANVAAGAPAGSYSLSGFENVNLFSGNLNFHLPLLQLGGRGGVTVSSVLSIDSVRWKLKRGTSETNDNDEPARLGSIGTIGRVILDVQDHDYWHSDTGTLINISRTYATEMVLDGTPESGQISGDTLYFWPDPDGIYSATPGYGPGLLEARTVSIGGRLRDSTPGKTLTRIVFTSPDGTEFELRDRDSGGAPFQHQRTLSTPPPHSRGTVFMSADGSSATFVADSPILEYFDYGQQMIPTYPAGNLYLPDGTRYRIVNGRVAWIRDRNGNLTTFDYERPGYGGRVAKAADSSGRVVNYRYDVRLPAGTPCPFNNTPSNPDGSKCWFDEIGFYGSGGAQRSIKIWHSALDQALRSGLAIGTFGTLFPEYEQAPVEKNAEYDSDSVVTAVELPDGRRYLLRYNAYNELARVELPTGGAFEYDYAGINSFIGVQRTLKERRVFKNASDQTPESIQSYVKQPGPDPNMRATIITVEQRDGVTNALLTSERHYFYGSPTTAHRGFYASWLEGREYQSETLAADGRTPLRRVESAYEARSYPSWYVSGQPQVSGPAIDPRPRESRTTLLDTTPALSSRQVFYYDADPALTYNLQTRVEEYGFDSELLRSTETEYLKSAAYADAPVHLRGLPLRKSVYDPAHKERARATFEYDNYTPDQSGNRHAELLPYGDIFGLCTDFDATGNCSNSDAASYKTRGNVTGTTSYLLDKEGVVTGSVTANRQYDIAGNVIKAVDARVRPDGGGYETLFDFQDRFGAPDAEARANNAPRELGGLRSYALPTAVTNALGQTAYTQYDYYTGQAVNSEDANGQATALEYFDLLDRPTRLTPPLGGGQVVNEYGDTVGNLFAKVRRQLDTNVWEEGVSYYDGLGRITKTQSHDAGGAVFSETVYDGVGRITKTSGPHRADEEAQWVETTYDALGRVKEVSSPKIGNETTPAKVKSEYSVAATGSHRGLVCVGINQADKRARSITNAQGQLVRLDEPDDAGDLGSIEDPNRPTYYQYDALGNLAKVTQGGQTRYFLYDSLRRLIRVRQPEQDINPNLAMSDPETGNSAWSTGFTYDENGNLLTTTDPKGVVTSYEYDSLNRVVKKSYSAPVTTDPKRVAYPTSTVAYKYDGALSPTQNNPNPSTVPFAKGILTEISNGVSTTQFTGFDNLGRVLSSKQIVDGQEYPFGYKYALPGALNLSGALMEETYPSGRVVTNSLDGSGDLSSVSSHMPNRVAKVYAGDLRYTADRSVDRIKLGNGTWETYRFNAREQITQIALGTSETDTSLWKVNYDYGRLNPDETLDVKKNDGNVVRQTITVPGMAAPYVQSYSYDPLNRLTEVREANGGRQTWRQTFAYDRYGNRTGFSQTTGQTQLVLNNVNNPEIDSLTNRIKAGQGYEYDLNGNLIQDAEGRKFDFDGDNKQSVVKDVNGNVIATYGYDANGRRVKKTVAATQEVTVFVYDASGKLAAEYSSVRPKNPTTRFVTADILGTPRVITDNSGGVISRKDYMPFGEDLFEGRSANQKYGYDTGVRQGFTGYEKDDETQFNFAESRYYNPSHGRFTTVDPMLASGASTNPQSFNRYVYAGNNPTLRIDQNGEDWFISRRPKLYGWETGEKIVHFWSNEPKAMEGFERLTTYIQRYNSGDHVGLFALDPWENRIAEVSSAREGVLQLEQFKRQAALNFIVGALEASSLVLDLSGALDGTGVEKDSEQYKLGQKAGFVGSSLAAASGVSLAGTVAGKFGKEGLALLRGAREAATGFRVGGRTFKEVAVIGKTQAALMHVGRDGVEVFRVASKYDHTINMKWVDDIIERGMPVELASPINKKTRFDEFGRLSVFGQEVERLKAAGYHQWGSYMLPPVR